jgi:RNA polymerase sigma-70 factor (ECF subfamily)
MDSGDIDRTLMRRVALRDEGAFAELAERFGGRLLGVARRLLRSGADAEDAVQRALLQCYLGAAAYRPEWAVSTWLYRILTNICVDEMRRRASRPATEAPPPGREPVDPASGSAADRVDMGRALERVPLRYVDGLSYQELARARGISVNTVKSQLARGKAILRSALREGGFRA